MSDMNTREIGFNLGNGECANCRYWDSANKTSVAYGKSVFSGKPLYVGYALCRRPLIDMQKLPDALTMTREDGDCRNYRISNRALHDGNHMDTCRKLVADYIAERNEMRESEALADMRQSEYEASLAS